MKSKLLLRMASVVVIFHDLGHSFGMLGWRHSPDPLKQEVINQMLGHKSPFMGADRSMADYFEGYSYAATIALLLIGVLLWMVSDAPAQNQALTKKILIAVAASLLIWGIDELIFFFPFAASFSLFAALFTILAIIKMKNVAPDPH